MLKFLKLIFFVLSVLWLAYDCTCGYAQHFRPLDSGEILLALKKLQNSARVLYIAAHPDDENTCLLAYFAKEKALGTAYLSLTRGAGGQNLIGSEKGDFLSVIRTQEIIAARKIDGAEQFFSRAKDFGYSKSSDETLAIWDKQKVLVDMVWVIRKFRPHVIITRFPPTGYSGHGQHRASAILALEAFQAAGDSRRFTEQLQHVSLWQPKRIVWNKWRPLQDDTFDTSDLIAIETGVYNPLLGKSYPEMATESYARHKTQGFGFAARRGSRIEYFSHIAGEPVNSDLFEGLGPPWSGIKGAEAVRDLLQRAYETFTFTEPHTIVPLLLKAYNLLDSMPPDDLLNRKKQELGELILQCCGLWFEAVSETPSAVPGGRVKLSARVIKRLGCPLELKEIHFTYGTKPIILDQALVVGKVITAEQVIRLPGNATYTHPYWLRKKSEKGTYTLGDPALIGLPEAQPALSCEFTFAFQGAEAATIPYALPVVYKWLDPADGEQYRLFAITPAATANMDASVYLFADNSPQQVSLMLRAHMPRAKGSVKLELPEAWQVQPQSLPFAFKEEGEEKKLTFTLYPPPKQSVGTVKAIMKIGDREFSNAWVTIKYPHIPVQTLYPPSQARLTRLDLKKKGQAIGYIMGAGDEIPDCLRQVGYDVTLLDDEQITVKNLKRFDAVITGIRAYNVNERLRLHQKLLLAYVQQGGTLIVQYNKNRNLITETIGPYPLTLSNDRVSDEEAPVTFTNPQHEILNTPNKITQADFEGWVSERGLYFPDTWDKKYQTAIACSDPGESSKNGGILTARYGDGVFIYTGYAWFRQLPAGIPGAYRIFANMIAYGRQ